MDVFALPILDFILYFVTITSPFLAPIGDMTIWRIGISRMVIIPNAETLVL
jgi:hypothetical protein